RSVVMRSLLPLWLPNCPSSCRCAARRTGAGLRCLVLGAPALARGDLHCDGGRVGAFVDLGAAEDLPGPMAVGPVDGQLVVVVGVDAGFLEDGPHDGGAVGPVVGEGLAGPVPGDEHPASTEAEVIAVVRLGLAVSRRQSRAGVGGLDAVAQPVG